MTRHTGKPADDPAAASESDPPVWSSRFCRFDQLEMKVEAVPGQPFVELGRERGRQAVAIGDIADEPAAENHVVGHLGDGPGQELDFHLFPALVVDLSQSLGRLSMEGRPRRGRI